MASRTGLILTAIAGVLSSCGGAAPPLRTRGLVPAPTETVDAPWLAGADPLAQSLRDTAAAIGLAGATPLTIGSRGFLVSKQTATVAIELPPRTCVTIAATASSGIGDLDAVLYSPDGVVLAQDVQPDRHPAIHACAQDLHRSVYYSVQAYEGSGSYVWGVFSSTRDAWQAIDRVLGGQPGIAADPGAEEPTAVVMGIETGFARRGFEPFGDPIDIPSVGPEPIRVPLQLEAGFCYSIVVVPHAEAGSVSLRVLGPLGDVLASDSSGSSHAAAQTCANESLDAAVEITARTEGGALFRVLRGAQTMTGDAANLWLGTRAQRRETDLANARALDAEASREGRARRIGTGNLGPGEARAHSLALRANRCTRVRVRTSDRLLLVVVRVLDENGALLRETTEADVPQLTLCSAAREHVTLAVIARDGSGEYEVETYDARLPEDLPEEASALERGPLVDALADDARRGFARRGSIHSMPLTDTPTGEHVRLEANECIRVHAITGGAGAHADLAFVGEGLTLRRASGQSPAIDVCAERAQELALQVVGRAASGRAFIAIGTRAAASR